VSRETFAKLNGKHDLLKYPDIEGFEYIIEYLEDLGFYDKEGNGLNFQEIQAWSNLTGVELSAWEATTLKHLSAEFSSQMRKTDKDEPTPYKKRG
jgi:hypothetical protein